MNQAFSTKVKNENFEVNLKSLASAILWAVLVVLETIAIVANTTKDMAVPMLVCIVIGNNIRNRKGSVIMSDIIMYIIINEDLNMSKRNTAEQAAHACSECVFQSLRQGIEVDKMELYAWHDEDQRKVVLGASQEFIEQLAADGRFYAVHNVDCDELPQNCLTAVCLGIHTEAEVAHLVKDLQLLQG